MRRLLQFGALMLLATALMPVLELFDRWDKPGLSNDTEFAVFAVVFALCLVLLICELISSAAMKCGVAWVRCPQNADEARHVDAGHTVIFTVPPLSLLPLRI